MTFISYAQNFEDVLLWRALKHIAHGFYIDVGANDPVEHSVTKAFYDHGWNGVNIEPLPMFRQAFLDQRPRDINLAVAAGATESEITLFDVPTVNGWASTDQAVASAHRREGFDVVELTVPLRTLSGICEQHAGREIHFLKIDVEGFEGEVLRGMDFTRWRPWILVIEATLPNSRITNHQSWEQLVTGHDYHFAHFDGLNRYYVAGEHIELRAVVSVQANVFDEFITVHLVRAWADAHDLRVQAQEADARSIEAVSLSNQALERASIADAGRIDAEAGRADAQAARIEAEAGRADAEAGRAEAQAGRAGAQARAHQSETEARAALARAIEAQAGALNAASWGAGLERQLLDIYASRSWRLSQPLRSMACHGASPAAFKRGVGQLLRRLARRLSASARLRKLVLPLLARFPALAARIARLAARVDNRGAPAEAAHQPKMVREPGNLPVSAREVLADLTRATMNPK
jgi:FkbM family methyltransferase